MTAEQDAEQLWLGELRVQIIDPRKETPGAQLQEGGDEAASTSTQGRSPTFVSYGVRAETTLPHFSRSHMVTRKRFQDFVFLHHTLVTDFPACIVPPLPDKHRIGTYVSPHF